MNERSPRPPNVTPDASRRFLRHESDRELLAAGSAALDRITLADSLVHRLAAWVDLIDWARSGPGAGELDDTGALSPRGIRRWTLLLDFLDAHPEMRARFLESTAEILAESESVNLFGATGVPSGRGFFAEFADRLMTRILPQPLD